MRCESILPQALVCAALLLGTWLRPAAAFAQTVPDLAALRPLIGGQDAVLVCDASGRELLAVNADTSLVPASTLKLLTALVALERLGPDYRFPTELYVTPARDLVIKGFGDPLLVSEEVAEICRKLAGEVSAFENIIVDESHFVTPVVIPGVGSSSEPYDAGNGALSVNFNTVAFRRQGAGFVSDEPQTPLLPLALPAIRATHLSAGRIALPSAQNIAARYAGELFRHFLVGAGIACRGQVRIGRLAPQRDRLLLRHESAYPLTEIVARLLAHSNNFIANQLLLTLGAAAQEAPGSLAKGVAVVRAHAEKRLQLRELPLVEGSGISRENRLSAHQLMRVLEAFQPWQHLMRRDGQELYKTGTLSGIQTRAGYFLRSSHEQQPIRFVVMVNTPQRSIDPLLARLRAALLDR